MIPRLAPRLLFAALAGAFAANTAAQPTQTYPTRPVRLVVGFTAGSATDILARVMAERFARTLGQVVARFQKPLESADLRHADGYAVRLRGVSTPAANGKNN